MAPERRFRSDFADAPRAERGSYGASPISACCGNPEELQQLSALQGALLRALFPQLKAGGRLVYCTCSVLPEEVEAVIAKFVAENPRGTSAFPPGSFGLAAGPGRQGLPTHKVPMAFYAVLEKVPAP